MSEHEHEQRPVERDPATAPSEDATADIEERQGDGDDDGDDDGRAPEDAPAY